MSLRDQNVRFRFQTLSELPTVIAQLEQINQLTEQQGKAANSSAEQVKAALLQQRNDTKATAEENLAISKEIARQTTLDKKAQLDIQVAQVKASEAQQTAFVQASEKERAILAEQIAKQSTNEQEAELKRRELQLAASESQKTIITKAEEDRRTAAVRATLLEQAQVAEQIQNQTTLELKAELNKRTLAAKMESDEQVAAFRQDQIRQTAILRSELAEQRMEMKQQNAAYQELRGFIASAFGVYEVLQFTRDVIDAKTTVDTFRLGLQQMVGTKKEADEVYVKLVEMAKTTPFGIEDIQKTTFALKAMGVATKDLLPTVDMLGNVAAVAGTDKLPLIAKAFTDVMNKGKLMKQELNQFSENSVPLLDLLATSLGKTRDEVVKMAEAHEISFAMVRDALKTATSEGGRYYNQMLIQSQTLGGQASNLADKFFLAKAKLGDYYQNGLQKVITGLDELVDILAGSDSAITRNTNFIKAAITAYLTYQGVANSVAIAEGALAAASVVKNGVMAAGQVIYGAYLLVVRAATFGLIEMTTAEMEATIATRAFGTALASNPLGVVIALLGAAVTAYYAYEAASAEVTTQLGEEQLKLASEQKNLNAVAEAAMTAAMGTKQRIEYINILKREWPDYFRGIDSEKVTNAELKTILDKVNTSYSARISLARQAYKLEGLQDEMKKNLQKEAEILAALPADLQAKYGGSITKAVADLFANPKIFDKINTDWKGQLGFGDFSFDEAKKVSDNLDRIGKKMVEVDNDIAKSQTTRTNAAEKAENARWEGQLKSLKAGSDEYKKEEQKHEDALDKIRDTAQKKEVTALVGHKTKLKDINIVSQKAIQDILLNNDDMSYQDKVKYYKNLEALELQEINKRRVNAKASEDDLAKIRKDALTEMQATKDKFDSIQRGLAILERQELSAKIEAEIKGFQDVNQAAVEYVFGPKGYITKTTTGFKEVAKAARDRAKDEIAAEKDLQEERNKTAQLVKEADKVEEVSRRKIIGLISEFANQASPMLGTVAKGVLQVIDHVENLNGASIKSSRDAVSSAQEHLKQLEIIYNAGMGGTQKGLEDAKQNVAETQKVAAKANTDAAVAVFGVMSAIYSVLSAVASAINEMMIETYKAIAEAMTDVRDAFRDLNQTMYEMNKSNYERDLAAFEGTLDQKLDMIRDYYEKEREFTQNRDRIDAELAFQAELANLTAGNKTMMEGFIEAQKNYTIAVQQESINRAESQMQEAKDVRDAKIAALEAAFVKFKETNQAQQDLARETFDQEKDLAAQKRDDDKNAVDIWLQGKKDAYSADLQAAKDAYQLNVDNVRSAYDAEVAILRAAQDAEQAAIRATYDLKQSLLTQATADQIEAVGILDRVRIETLGRYEEDERARITATRDRILATLTDEGERARVTAEYDKQLAELHKTVEDGKLDKSKGVTLATTQLNREAKEEAERLKKEESDTLTTLANNYQTLFKNLADERDSTLKKLKDDEEIRERELKTELTKLERQAADDKEKIQNDYKEKISTLEKDLKDQIAALKKELVDKAVADNQVKKRIEFELKQATIQYQQDVFNAQKQMKIAELQADIAVLNSKKNWFNEGKIIDAVGKIEQSIAAINGLQLNNSASVTEYLNAYDLNAAGNPKRPLAPTGQGNQSFEVDFPVFDKNGNPAQITYSESQDRKTVYRADGSPVVIIQADVFIPATGERYAQGTESVGGKYPDGIDTVPAWLTKGERVLTVAQNKLLGGISNEDLVTRHQFFQSIDMSGISGRISLPDGVVGSDGKSPVVDLSGIEAAMQENTSALKNLKQLNLNIDQNGLAVWQQDANSIVNHYSSLLKR